jgi:hypothetical protein
VANFSNKRSAPDNEWTLKSINEHEDLFIFFLFSSLGHVYLGRTWACSKLDSLCSPSQGPSPGWAQLCCHSCPGCQGRELAVREKSLREPHGAAPGPSCFKGRAWGGGGDRGFGSAVSLTLFCLSYPQVLCHLSPQPLGCLNIDVVGQSDPV